jgi:hypothetical protein
MIFSTVATASLRAGARRLSFDGRVLPTIPLVVLASFVASFKNDQRMGHGRSICRLEEEKASKAYEHDPSDFDVYLSHPTADDLPLLLHKFDREGQDVWPWIWTHPNDSGPHHVFVIQGENLSRDIMERIQLLRKASAQNNILILLDQEDDSLLERSAKDHGMPPDMFRACHAGIVTGVKVELLNIPHKILMLDDERVIAFDYLTVC